MDEDSDNINNKMIKKNSSRKASDLYAENCSPNILRLEPN
jgi:hypothetical protein